MVLVSLLDVKVHLSVALEDQGNDALIQSMIDAAADHLQSIDVDVSADPLPPALHHAILMLVGHYYENREATSDAGVHVVPLGVARLIAPYRSINL